MIGEMLLNNDIRKKLSQIILHFQKEVNEILYIIERVSKVNFYYFIWTKN
jgi:hypothetical protein